MRAEFDGIVGHLRRGSSRLVTAACVLLVPYSFAEKVINRRISWTSKARPRPLAVQSGAVTHRALFLWWLLPS
jgi:hypothetical protein